jgi:CheY-like chemotaxis protein
MAVTNVLVVDDSALIVKLVIKFLLQNNIDGHTFDEDHIFTASDGMEAFETISTYPEITLIISDVNMPMLNGDELLEILIDTDKLSTMEVILVTGKETADQLSKTTRKNILGVIHKPFNKDTFPEQFNAFIVAKQSRLDDLIVIQKENQAKQGTSFDVIVAYLKELGLIVDFEVIRSFLAEQFGYDARVLDEDVVTLINIVLDEYYAVNEIEEAVDDEVLHRCYIQIKHPNKIFSIIDPFNLQKNFETVLGDVNEYMNAAETIDAKETLSMIFKEIEDMISIIIGKVKHYPKINHQLLQPHFNLIVDRLSAIDPDFNDYDLQEMMAEYKELMVFHKWMKVFYQKTQIYTKIPKLKSSKNLIDQTNKKLQIVFKYISASILHYTGALEHQIWAKAKASSAIMRFFRKNLPEKIPNSKDFLWHLEKIDKSTLKDYEVLEHENVMIISNFLATLQEIKNKQEENLPLWQMQGFSKETLIESWLASNTPTKLILDYDFSSPVYRNGLEFLFHLKKKFPAVAKLLKGGHLFILCSNAKVEELREKKRDIEFVLISKPLKAIEIKTALLYS